MSDEKPRRCAHHHDGSQQCADVTDCCACVAADSVCEYHSHFLCEREANALRARLAEVERDNEHLRGALAAIRVNHYERSDADSPSCWCGSDWPCQEAQAIDAALSK